MEHRAANALGALVRVAILLVGCSPSHTVAPDATPTLDATAEPDAASACPPGPTCSGHYAVGLGAFGPLERACGSDADCAVAFHWNDCCSNAMAAGIARTALACFDAREAACRAGLLGCGCPGLELQTDTTPPFVLGGADERRVIVECVSGACTTRLRTAQPCGSGTCADTEACFTPCGGAPTCRRVDVACVGSTDCVCLGGIDPCGAGHCVAMDQGAPTCACP